MEKLDQKITSTIQSFSSWHNRVPVTAEPWHECTRVTRNRQAFHPLYGTYLKIDITFFNKIERQAVRDYKNQHFRANCSFNVQAIHDHTIVQHQHNFRYEPRTECQGLTFSTSSIKTFFASSDINETTRRTRCSTNVGQIPVHTRKRFLQKCKTPVTIQMMSTAAVVETPTVIQSERKTVEARNCTVNTKACTSQRQHTPKTNHPVMKSSS